MLRQLDASHYAATRLAAHLEKRKGLRRCMLGLMARGPTSTSDPSTEGFRRKLDRAPRLFL